MRERTQRRPVGASDGERGVPAIGTGDNVRVAILQNSIGVGGRSKVVSRVVRLFTGNGWSVDLHSFADADDFRRFRSHYGLDDARLNLVSYDAPSVPGTIYRQPLLNVRSRRELASYDLVFNSNNCVRFLPDEPTTIHYVHLPTPSIPSTNTRYRTPMLRAYSAPISLLSRFEHPVDPADCVLANSAFTLERAREVYDFESAEVVYPPCIPEVEFDGFSGDGVVSVGSFHPNKRQLFQLKVAERLPGTRFTLVGSKASGSYFGKCERYVRRNGLDNVELLPDASDEELADVLSESRIFLHSMRNEPFGIVTVEALNSGCVPVVHDSGGQREIVPHERLRFADLDECVEVVSAVRDGRTSVPADVERHLEQFTVAAFDTGLLDSMPAPPEPVA